MANARAPRRHSHKSWSAVITASPRRHRTVNALCQLHSGVLGLHRVRRKASGQLGARGDCGSVTWARWPQGSCKVVRQALDLLGCRRRETAIWCRLRAVASKERPPSRSDLDSSQVLTMQVKGTAAAQEARPRPLAAITAVQAAQS
jgi:hypothetical protein